MRADEMLVVGITMALSIVAAVAAIGPWGLPYELRLPRILKNRYGMAVARVFYLLLALLLGAIALVIALGIRPNYATL